ncbi:hypothetical protein C8J57DRAFT_1253660 [Mycena rebaudengoi]|nr:hypothetical protein C8J57DRAFT_1253660 [Mycena rebaudengoi]
MPPTRNKLSKDEDTCNYIVWDILMAHWAWTYVYCIEVRHSPPIPSVSYSFNIVGGTPPPLLERASQIQDLLVWEFWRHVSSADSKRKVEPSPYPEGPALVSDMEIGDQVVVRSNIDMEPPPPHCSFPRLSPPLDKVIVNAFLIMEKFKPFVLSSRSRIKMCTFCDTPLPPNPRDRLLALQAGYAMTPEEKRLDRVVELCIGTNSKQPSFLSHGRNNGHLSPTLFDLCRDLLDEVARVIFVNRIEGKSPGAGYYGEVGHHIITIAMMFCFPNPNECDLMIALPAARSKLAESHQFGLYLHCTPVDDAHIPTIKGAQTYVASVLKSQGEKYEVWITSPSSKAFDMWEDSLSPVKLEPEAQGVPIKPGEIIDLTLTDK